MAKPLKRRLDLNDAPPGYYPVPARQVWGNHTCAGCALLRATVRESAFGGTYTTHRCGAMEDGLGVRCVRHQRDDGCHVRYEKLPDAPPPAPKKSRRTK